MFLLLFSNHQFLPKARTDTRKNQKNLRKNRKKSKKIRKNRSKALKNMKKTFTNSTFKHFQTLSYALTTPTSCPFYQKRTPTLAPPTKSCGIAGPGQKLAKTRQAG
jgi:hypothetical protein